MLRIKSLRITQQLSSHLSALQPSQQPKRLLALQQLEINSGEIATLLGPSGSGKTTLLRWVLGEPLTGFEQQGELWLNGQRIDHYPIHLRKIGLLYQKGDLFPHLSVKENLLFALPRKYSKPQKQQRAEEALATIELASKRDAMPHHLSGGEQSRIALIRSLLAEPAALLLDEPFSALDSSLRSSIRQWTFAQIKQRNIPALLVTHDESDHGDGPIINLGTQDA
jgi:putative thiamine transport system ATP-binding protein